MYRMSVRLLYCHLKFLFSFAVLHAWNREEKKCIEGNRIMFFLEKDREKYLPRHAAGCDSGPQVWMRRRGSVWISSKLNFNYWVLNGDRELQI